MSMLTKLAARYASQPSLDVGRGTTMSWLPGQSMMPAMAPLAQPNNAKPNPAATIPPPQTGLATPQGIQQLAQKAAGTAQLNAFELLHDILYGHLKHAETSATGGSGVSSNTSTGGNKSMGASSGAGFGVHNVGAAPGGGNPGQHGQMQQANAPGAQTAGNPGGVNGGPQIGNMLQQPATGNAGGVGAFGIVRPGLPSPGVLGGNPGPGLKLAAQWTKAAMGMMTPGPGGMTPQPGLTANMPPPPGPVPGQVPAGPGTPQPNGGAPMTTQQPSAQPPMGQPAQSQPPQGQPPMTPPMAEPMQPPLPANPRPPKPPMPMAPAVAQQTQDLGGLLGAKQEAELGDGGSQVAPDGGPGDMAAQGMAMGAKLAAFGASFLKTGYEKSASEDNTAGPTSLSRGWQWRYMQQEADDGKKQWMPRQFTNDSTPLAELLASPGKQGLLGAGLGAGLGGAAGVLASDTVGGGLAGAGIGGLLGGVLGYGRQRKRNDVILDDMHHLPPGATVGDRQQLKKSAVFHPFFDTVDRGEPVGGGGIAAAPPASPPPSGPKPGLLNRPNWMVNMHAAQAPTSALGRLWGAVKGVGTDLGAGLGMFNGAERDADLTHRASLAAARGTRKADLGEVHNARAMMDTSRKGMPAGFWQQVFGMSPEDAARKAAEPPPGPPSWFDPKATDLKNMQAARYDGMASAWRKLQADPQGGSQYFEQLGVNSNPLGRRMFNVDAARSSKRLLDNIAASRLRGRNMLLGGGLALASGVAGYEGGNSLLGKQAAQAEDGQKTPARSATGESVGLSFAHKPDDYATGQPAWESVAKYLFRSTDHIRPNGRRVKVKQPDPFSGIHKGASLGAPLPAVPARMPITSQAPMERGGGLGAAPPSIPTPPPAHNPLDAGGGPSLGSSPIKAAGLTPFAEAFFERCLLHDVDPAAAVEKIASLGHDYPEAVYAELQDGLVKLAALGRSQGHGGVSGAEMASKPAIGAPATPQAFPGALEKLAFNPWQTAKTVGGWIGGKLGMGARTAPKAAPQARTYAPGAASNYTPQIGATPRPPSYAPGSSSTWNPPGMKPATPLDQSWRGFIGQQALGSGGGAAMGAFEGHNSPWDTGSIWGNAAMGAAAFNPFLNRRIMGGRGLGAALNAPMRSMQGSMVGASAGGGIDFLAGMGGMEGSYGPDGVYKPATNFARMGGTLGGAFGLAGGTGRAMRQLAPAGSAINRFGTKVMQFGEGGLAPLMPGRNPLLPLPKMVTGLPAAASRAGKAGRKIAYGLGGVLGMRQGLEGFKNTMAAHGRDTADAYLEARLPQLQQQMGQGAADMADQWLQQRGLLNDQGQVDIAGPAINHVAHGADGIFRAMGLDPARLSPLQKMMMLGGAGMAGGGAMMGSPMLAGAGGLAMLGGGAPYMMGGGRPGGQHAMAGPGGPTQPPPNAMTARNEWQHQQQYNNRPI